MLFSVLYSRVSLCGAAQPRSYIYPHPAFPRFSGSRGELTASVHCKIGGLKNILKINCILYHKVTLWSSFYRLGTEPTSIPDKSRGRGVIEAGTRRVSLN